ncbi:exo-alpha-sialidase [Celerinatantimonas yamalensis]|uniref:Exo-alpha-sialidase n=1 Tax=Celerinatantimonas yamalensis TaxID=559956 RepID=A0ABW9G814_9GAMM
MALTLLCVHDVASDVDAHLAFTDLCRFDNKLWLAYRRASSHHRKDGEIVILTGDGEQWCEQARIGGIGDWRDPKFSISSAGLLLLNCACISPDGLHSLLYRLDENIWQSNGPIAPVHQWLWRTHWVGSYGYSFAYQRPDLLQLYRVNQTLRYQLWQAQPLGDLAKPNGYPNESGLTSAADGTMYCLLRRDGDDPRALLGQSQAPYQDWQWQVLDKAIGGPVLTMTPDGQLLCVVRLYQPARTSVCLVDPERGQVIEQLRLPSGGDTSYAGIVWRDAHHLDISYYSSHQHNRCSIYLARLSYHGDTAL